MNEKWDTNDSFSYKRMYKRHPSIWKFVNSFIKDENITSVLDVGCGMHQLYQFSGDWAGIDVNPKIQKDKIIKADFLKYSFDRKFDMVLIMGVVEHYLCEHLKQFIEKSLEVNPKYVLIGLFGGIKEKGHRRKTIVGRHRVYSLTEYGKDTFENIFKELGIKDFQIKELSKKDVVIIVRRK